ncbi:MAG: MazG-like family protein [Planctomycetota bacterium]|jgi:NTP pyrophosphatase (non-canonical NTP hydrolase)
MQEFIKIRGWAHARNLVHGSTPEKQMVKLVEEIGELAAGLARGDSRKVIDSIGDAVVVLTILSEQIGVNIEECIVMAYDEIKDRKGKMVNGVFIKEGD